MVSLRYLSRYPFRCFWLVSGSLINKIHFGWFPDGTDWYFWWQLTHGPIQKTLAPSWTILRLLSPINFPCGHTEYGLLWMLYWASLPKGKISLKVTLIWVRFTAVRLETFRNNLSRSVFQVFSQDYASNNTHLKWCSPKVTGRSEGG